MMQQAPHVAVARGILFHELRAAKTSDLVEQRQAVRVERRVRRSASERMTAEENDS